MQKFEAIIPGRMIFGPGRLGLVAEVTKQYGSRALIVTGRQSMKKSGVLNRVTDLLAKGGISYEVWDRVEPNPPSQGINEGAEFARRFGADVVIGLGGGSSMDAAKAIAIATFEGRPIEEFMRSVRENRMPREASGALPVIAVPTTSGTGSEVNRYAVVTNSKTREKLAVRSDHGYPKVALLDPELTLTLPKGQTAATGIDVLFHAIEAYLSTKSHAMSEMFSERAIYLVGRSLVRAYDAGTELQSRIEMSLASMFAGIAIDMAGTILLHGVGHPVSGHFNVTHGESLSALSRGFIRCAFRDQMPKVKRVFALLEEGGLFEDEPIGKILEGLSGKPLPRHAIPPETPQEAEVLLTAFLKRLGLPTSLKGFNIPEESIPTLMEDVFGVMSGSVENYPGDISREDVEGIYREAL